MNSEELKEYIKNNLLTKQEAMKITGQGLSAFNQAISTGKLKAFYDKGKGRSRVRLYHKSDVQEYAKSVELRRQRIKK